MQRAGGAYFVNKYGTFWKEENFNFPEHQKILKSIKNPFQKMEKSETFSKIFENFEKSKNRKIRNFWKKIENSKFSKNLKKSRFSMKNRKSEKSEKI